MQANAIFSLLWPVLVCLPLISAGLSQTKRAWQWAEFIAASSFFLALAGWIALVPLHFSFHLLSWLEISPLRASLVVLVSFIAYIVVRYARSNFNQDADNAFFLRWLTITIFAVMLTMISNHLVLFWLAWVFISYSIHKLLVFYPSRYRAVLAAHKKFLFARITELCLGIAFVLLYIEHNSFLISDIVQYNFQHYPDATISWQQQLAVILIAVVALIKCAQLPFHGWLIQVVESPTPVSALLHAGIVNLGGFLLLLFAPLFSQVLSAQWLILIVAGLTTCIASLVMMTRISVKVRLAWSTTAQMGLMLVECALGLYDLALLHLAAHSCYKANEFLRAGSAVSDDIQKQYTGRFKVGLKPCIAAFFITTLLLISLNLLLPIKPPYSPWVLIIIAVTVSLAIRINQSIRLSYIKGIVDALLLIGLYVAFKFSAGLLLPTMEHSYNLIADAWISSLFIIMLLLFLLLHYRPLNPLAQKLFISLNAGLYLDEWSTRATLRIWPITLPAPHIDNVKLSDAQK